MGEMKLRGDEDMYRYRFGAEIESREQLQLLYFRVNDPHNESHVRYRLRNLLIASDC